MAIFSVFLHAIFSEFVKNEFLSILSAETVLFENSVLWSFFRALLVQENIVSCSCFPLLGSLCFSWVQK